MGNEEQQILAAAHAFYDAIEDIATGKGIGTMEAVWDHTPQVTSAHPTGEWIYGWDEVRASWQVFASFGRPESGGNQIRDLKVHYYGGDLAYTTGIYVPNAAFGGGVMNCTNVFRRVDGAWKVVHHHADKAQSLVDALEKGT